MKLVSLTRERPRSDRDRRTSEALDETLKKRVESR